MALRKLPAPEAIEDSVPLPKATFATVLVVGDETIAVTLAAPPVKEPHSGACACEACGTATLADLALRFSR